MSYQVLARKWRPKNFRELVGQEHVMRALINALDNERLHHAYLFTGTRGVGKTTIARIFAKCLNCEQGITSSPCGECSACQEINQGRFVDLIEVDAASRTKVEDTREILDNVQYAPARGRYKVYLIDEVHMLSNNSFNALLKTLEEPPEHVKFLLATTDPQKLPVTILSRCLQFNLKNMSSERIVHHLSSVLEQEQVPNAEAALWLLARSANGSMRDALSLTDQAIAYGNGKISEQDAAAMLGTIDQRQIVDLLDALINADGAGILKNISAFAEFSPDYDGALAELITLLHRIAIAQTVPEALDNSQGDKQDLINFASRLRPEDVQLFYQMGLVGRRDLPLSPDLRAGFEMILLRMLAFRPHTSQAQLPKELPAQIDQNNSHSAVTLAHDDISGGSETGKKLSTELRPADIAETLPEAELKPELKSESKLLRQEGLDAPDKPVLDAPAQAAPMSEKFSSTAAAVNEVKSRIPANTLAVSENSGPKSASSFASPNEVSPNDIPPMNDNDLSAIAQAMIDSYSDDQYTEAGQNIAPNHVAPKKLPSQNSPMTESQPAIESDSLNLAESLVEMDSGADAANVVADVADVVVDVANVASQTNISQENFRRPSIREDGENNASKSQVNKSKSRDARRDQLGNTDKKVHNAQTYTDQGNKEHPRISLDQFDRQNWVIVYEQLQLKGVLQNTAANCVLVSQQGNLLNFVLESQRSSLFDGGYEQRLEQALTQYFSCAVKITISLGGIPEDMETPSMIFERWRKAQLECAVQDINNNTVVQALKSSFDARVHFDQVTLIEKRRGPL